MKAASSFLSYLWGLSQLHPGVVFVLVGVAGEGLELLGRLIWRKRSEKLDLALETMGLFFWAIVVVGLVMEMSEAAHSDNEVIALNQKIARIDPLNVPIHSMRADVFLMVRGDFSRNPVFFPNQTILKGAANIPIQGALPTQDAWFIIFGKDGAWLTLNCDKIESSEYAGGRRFSMSFSWPSPDLATVELKKANWSEFIVRNNLTPSDLDKANVTAGILFFGFDQGLEVSEGTCALTMNGDVARNFPDPKFAQGGLVRFSVMQKEDRR